MTPSQVLTSVRNQLYEPTASFWSDSELYGYMWDAEREIAQLIPCTEISTATTTVTDTSSYTSPSDVLYYDRVTYDGVKLKRIGYTDRDALDNPSYGGTLSTGDPTHYIEYGSSVILWPVPDADKTLRYFYYREPAQITTASTEFTVPNMMHHFLQDYVLYRAHAKDQNEGLSNYHKRSWDENLGKAASNWAQRYMRDGHYVARDEDSYPETELGII